MCAGWVGLLPGGSAWVSLYENTSLPSTEISIQIFRQPFCWYLRLMFRIHSLYIHILTPWPWSPAAPSSARCLYPVNVKVSVLDCRWRNAEFQSHTVHLTDDADVASPSDYPDGVLFVNIPRLYFTSGVFRSGQCYMLVDRRMPGLIRTNLFYLLSRTKPAVCP